MEKMHIRRQTDIGTMDVLRVMATVDFVLTFKPGENIADFSKRCGEVFAGRVSSYLTAKSPIGNVGS